MIYRNLFFIFVVCLVLVGVVSGDSAYYYFDSYSVGTAWATSPANMVDGTETSYASTITNGDVELLNGNNASGADLGNITSVEIRAYGYYSSDDEVTLVPVFGGASDGDSHTSAVPATSGAWGSWFDITSDTNAPGTWAWADVQNLDCDVNYVKSGGGQLTYVGEVEIRVNYTSNDVPTLGNVTASHSIIKGGDTITFYANYTQHGLNDSNGDTLYLYCSSEALPSASNTNCTGGITSDASDPYALTCTFAVPFDDVNHTEHCRVYDGIGYSSSVNTTYVSDSSPPSTSVVSVAGDGVASYYDNVDDDVSEINVSGEASMVCRWSNSDVVYASMSNDCVIYGSVARCAVNDIASQGLSTRYVSCQDSLGNFQDTSQNLNVQFYLDYTAPISSDDSDTSMYIPTYVVNFTESDNVDADPISYYCSATSVGCNPVTLIDNGGQISYTSANRGVNYLRYYSVDDANNTQVVVNKTININRLPVFISAWDNATIIGGGDLVNVSFNYSELDVGQTVTFYVCDSVSVTSAGCGGGHYCNVSADTNSSCIFTAESDSALHNWYAFAYDELGEMAVVNFSGLYTADSTAPVITIVNPANDTLTDDDITAQITLDEDGSLAWYELDGNGSNVSMGNSSTTSWNANIYNLSLGSHNLTFWANDSYGNVGVSARRYFEISAPVDTTAPAITILSPENESYQTASGIYINITVDEDLKGAWYELNYNGTKILLGNLTSRNWNVNVSLSEESEYNLTIWANDSSDNENTKNISFYVDSLAPRYFNASASPSVVNVSQAVNCSINWSDGFNLSSVKISENSSGSFENHSIVSPELGGSFSYNIVGNKLTVLGSYECRFYAVDVAGNFNSTSVSFLVSDVSVPVITVTSPSNATYNQNYLDVSLIVSENSSWAGYSLNGASNVTMGNTSMTAWNKTLTSLSNEGYNIQFFANDSSGNMANSSLIHFAINTGAADTTAPVITINSVSNASYKTATSVVVNVTTNENADWVGYKLNSGSLTDMSNLTSATEWNVTLTSLGVESSNDLEVYSNDSTDNEGSKNITFYVDSVAPRIINISVSPSPANESQNVVCNAYVNDTFSLSSVKIEENASNVGVFENHTLDLSASGWMNYTILNVEKGVNYTCRFYATDSAGNVNNSELITFAVNDVTAPVISINSPLNQSYSSDSILLSVSLSEDAVVPVNYTIDGGVTNVSLSGSGNSWSDSVVFSDGSKTATFYASDSSWNNASNSVTFTVDTSVNDVTAPVITVWSPLNNSYDIDGTVLLNISTNEDLSWAGYSNNSADLIDLDNVSTTYWNASVVFAEGEHNLTFYANDSSSNKNQGSKAFVFYVDLTNPDVEGFACTDVNDSLNVVCNANVSDEVGLSNVIIGDNFTGSWINSSNFSLSGLSYGFNYTINSGNTSPGDFGAEIYLFDSSGRMNFSVSDIVTIADDSIPEISVISYVPNTTDGLDAGVIVNVTCNVSEDYNISSVELMYKNLSSAGWSSVVMSNGSALTYLSASNVTYNATFTVQNETWYFQINATDSVGNSDISSNYTLVVEDDISQNISTTIGNVESFTFAQRTSNNSLGRLSLNNTGDGSLNFNVSLSGSSIGDRLSVNYSRNRTLNYSVDSDLGVNISVEINSSGLDAGLYDYNISVSSDAGTVIYEKYVNIQASVDPYLETSIDSYSSTVIKGQTDLELVASILNSGTVEATGVYLNWTLPEGFTLVSGSLSRNLGNLGVDLSGTNTIVINVDSDALDSNVSLIATASSSNANSSIDSKTVTIGTGITSVVTVAGPTTSGGGGGGSAGGGGGGVSSVYSKVIEVVRGESDEFSIDIFNKYSNSTLENVSISLIGYYEQYLLSSPLIIPRIDYNETKSFNVKLIAPSYKNYEEHDLKAVIRGNLVQHGIMNSYSETQNLKLIIQEVARGEVDIGLEEAVKAVELMKKKNFNVEEVERLLGLAKNKLKERKNDQVYDLVKEIIKIKEKAFFVDNILSRIVNVLKNPRKVGLLTGNIVIGFEEDYNYNYLKGKIDGNSDWIEDIKDSDNYYFITGNAIIFDDKPIEELLELAVVAFDRGDYNLAGERAESAQILLLLNLKGNFVVFLYLYWHIILLGMIVFSVAGVLGFRKYQKTSISKNIDNVDKKEDNILKLMQNVQANYFAGKISAGDYHRISNQHQKEIVKIRKFRINLRSRRIKVLKSREVIKDLDLERTQVESEIKKLQKNFYGEHKLSEKDYKFQFESLNERLAEIEGERITLELMQKKKGLNKDNPKNNGAPYIAPKVYSSSKRRGLKSPLFLGSSKAYLHTLIGRFRLIFEDKKVLIKNISNEKKEIKSVQRFRKNSFISKLNFIEYFKKKKELRKVNEERRNKMKVDSILKGKEFNKNESSRLLEIREKIKKLFGGFKIFKKRKGKKARFNILDSYRNYMDKKILNREKDFRERIKKLLKERGLE